MSDGRKKGPYGCKCQTLAHKLVGDGCDECQPMSDAPERVWLDPATYTCGDANAENVEYIRADIHNARCVGEDGIDHQSYTEAALEEAQVVTDLRAEVARLREKLSAFEGALTVEVAKTEAARRLVHEIGAEGLMAENARLRETLRGMEEALELGAAIMARVAHRIDPADTGLLRMVHEYMDALNRETTDE